MSDHEPPDGVPIVHNVDAEKLNRLQREDYAAHRRKVLGWLANVGKDPDRAEGYSDAVVENTAYRLSRIHRWVWEREGYTAALTHDHADAFVDELRTRDWGDENKNQYVKTLKRYFAWRTHESGVDEWEPEQTYTPKQQTHHARDYLTLDERQRVRDAALEYASIPAYDHVSPDERDRWTAHLAQRFGVPKAQIGPDEWARATSWKVPSLVATGLDAGLRPIEVERARVSWVDPGNAVLRIPKEEDAKGTGGGENWVVSLREDTAGYLERWLAERNARPKYDDSDRLWLTSHANPFGSSALNYVLDKICDEAEIPTEERDLSWYSIRHSTGTYMAREEGLAAAQSQLRHRSEATTMRYDQTPPEDRRDALGRM
jgi:integrase